MNHEQRINEICARQIEAECYDLEALELEATLPPPPEPVRTAVACTHAVARIGEGIRCDWCGKPRP